MSYYRIDLEMRDGTRIRGLNGALSGARSLDDVRKWEIEEASVEACIRRTTKHVPDLNHEDVAALHIVGLRYDSFGDFLKGAGGEETGETQEIRIVP